MTALALLMPVIWLGAGGYGVYVYFKHRDGKHKTKLYWSLATIAIGIWWAISVLK